MSSSSPATTTSTAQEKTEQEKKEILKEISVKSKRTNKVYKIQYQGELDSEDMENYRGMVEEWENEELGSDRDDN
jgi:hypothetical protein